MGVGIRGHLINDIAASYGLSYQEHLFRQYIHYAESAEKISERRVAANNYLLTVNSVLVAIYGVTPALHTPGYWSVLLPLAGLLVSAAWFQVVTSYKELNSIKYGVVHELEEKLPAALYSYEWYKAELGRGDKYHPTSHLERAIPIIFACLYIALMVARLLT